MYNKYPTFFMLQIHVAELKLHTSLKKTKQKNNTVNWIMGIKSWLHDYVKKKTHKKNTQIYLHWFM